MTDKIRPVILAGGAGTRLWPMSRRARPKHLLPLVGPTSLLEQTLARVADHDRFCEPLVVCGADQVEAISAIVPGVRLLVEPCARNSGPAIALAAACEEPGRTLLVLPSDHHLVDPQPLLDAVEAAAAAARDGWIVTFGITPTRPETGFGYIVPGAVVDGPVLEVDRFHEKPDVQTAGALIAAGARWNAGIFLMRADVVLGEFARQAPAIHDCAREALAGQEPGSGRITPALAALQDCPAISFDYAVMERARRAAVMPVRLDWSDLGSWAAVHELAAKDAAGNALDNRALAIDCTGCLVRSDGPQVVAIGVSDLVVVATASHVLVVPRAQAQRVREAAEQSSDPG